MWSDRRTKIALGEKKSLSKEKIRGHFSIVYLSGICSYFPNMLPNEQLRYVDLYLGRWPLEALKNSTINIISKFTMFGRKTPLLRYTVTSSQRYMSLCKNSRKIYYLPQKVFPEQTTSIGCPTNVR